MKNRIVVFFAAVFGIVLVIGVLQPAYSQEAEEEEFMLEDIVVTGTKRDQPIQDIPIAITITSKEQIERQQIYTLQDLSRSDAGLEFGDTGAGPGGVAIVRGIGTSVHATQYEPSVGVIVDGIPQGSVNIGNMFDVERVEVLKGPQGTLFGKGASAGIINIVTVSPNLAEFEAKVGIDATFDDKLGSKYGRQEYRVMMNVPVTENSAIRAAVNFNKTEGLRKNLTAGMKDNDSDNFDLGIKYLYMPSDNFALNLKAEYAKREEDGPNLFVIRNIPPDVSLYDHFTGPECGIVSSEQNQHVCSTFDFLDTEERFGLSATVNWRMLGHDFVSITSYRESAFGPYNQNIFGYDWAPNFLEIRRWSPGENITEHVVQELRIHAPAGQRLNYLAGLYYDGEQREPDDPNARFTQHLYPPLPFRPPPGFPVPFPAITIGDTATYTENVNYAIFADGDYAITDAFKIFGGLRFSKYTVDLEQVSIDTGATDLSADYDDDFFTWRGGVQYDFTDDTMMYALVSTGVKAPILSPPGPTADPDTPPQILVAEEATSYEAGTKFSMLDGKLAMDLNVFYTEFDDYQGQECDYDEYGSLTCVGATIPNIETKGFEISTFGRPIPDLVLNAGYMYNIAEYPSEYGPLAGYQLMNALKHKFVFSGEYGKPVTDTLYGFVSFDTVYKSDKRLNTDLEGASVFPAHWKFGARIGVRQIDGKWSLTLFGRNLSEEPEPVILFNVMQGITVGIPSESSFRQVGIRADIRF